MARTQKNKATSFHLGQLKAKLAKLKRELLTPTSGGGGGGTGFDVARTGVASIGFIGFPSVGKSTLMSKLTGQHSEVAAYEFTTLTSVPGQVIYNGKSTPPPDPVTIKWSWASNCLRCWNQQHFPCATLSGPMVM